MLTTLGLRGGLLRLLHRWRRWWLWLLKWRPRWLQRLLRLWRWW